MVWTCTANCVLITRDKLYPQKVQNNKTVRWKRESQLILLLACRSRQPYKGLGEGEPFKIVIAKVSKSPVCKNKNKAQEEQSRGSPEFQRGLGFGFFSSFFSTFSFPS